MIYLPLSVMFGLGAAAIAHDKGRGVYAWMLAGVLAGPLALAVVLLPPASARPASPRLIAGGETGGAAAGSAHV